MRQIRGILSLSCIFLLSACDPDFLSDYDYESLGVITNSIVGGEIYTGTPSVGLITYDGQEHCTGTVISPRKVLTAAHCVVNPYNPSQILNASRMRFVIGPSIHNQQHSLTISSLQPHPNFILNHHTIDNDIAVMHLTHDAPVPAIPLVRSMDSSWIGRSLFFVGYGIDNGFTGTGGGIKRAVSLSINEMQPRLFKYHEQNRSPCHGDSGGPAFDGVEGDFRLAGVTSHGAEYCIGWGASFRVDPYLDFIDVPEDPGPDISPPTIHVNLPDRDVLPGNSRVTIQADIEDDRELGDAFLLWHQDGAVTEMRCSAANLPPLVSCEISGASHTWNFPVSSGQRSFSIRALDAAGNEEITTLRNLTFNPDLPPETGP